MIPLSLILILAGLLAIFLGFKGRIVQTKGPRCPNPRCFYPLAASIERRAEQHQGVEYGYPIVCPECGRMTASPVEARWSYRKFRMRRVYLGLALLVIGAPLLIGTNMLRAPSPLVLRNMPTSILLRIATTDNQYGPGRELLRRVHEGEFTGAEADELAERLMEVQNEPFFALSPLAEALYTLIDAKLLSPEVAELAEQRLWSFEINIPTRVEPGARIPIEIIAMYRGPAPGPLTTTRGGVSDASMVFLLERLVVNDRRTDLSNRRPVRTNVNRAMLGGTAGVRYSLPPDDPVLNAALTAPTTEGKYRVELFANWRVESGFPYFTKVHLGGDIFESRTVRVTATPQTVAPTP